MRLIAIMLILGFAAAALAPSGIHAMRGMQAAHLALTR